MRQELRTSTFVGRRAPPHRGICPAVQCSAVLGWAVQLHATWQGWCPLRLPGAVVSQRKAPQPCSASASLCCMPDAAPLADGSRTWAGSPVGQPKAQQCCFAGPCFLLCSDWRCAADVRLWRRSCAVTCAARLPQAQATFCVQAVCCSSRPQHCTEIVQALGWECAGLALHATAALLWRA